MTYGDSGGPVEEWSAGGEESRSGKKGSVEGRWGCMAGRSEGDVVSGWDELARILTTNITRFQMNSQGREEKSIKDEAWFFLV